MAEQQSKVMKIALDGISFASGVIEELLNHVAKECENHPAAKIHGLKFKVLGQAGNAISIKFAWDTGDAETAVNAGIGVLGDVIGGLAGAAAGGALGAGGGVIGVAAGRAGGSVLGGKGGTYLANELWKNLPDESKANIIKLVAEKTGLSIKDNTDDGDASLAMSDDWNNDNVLVINIPEIVITADRLKNSNADSSLDENLDKLSDEISDKITWELTQYLEKNTVASDEPETVINSSREGSNTVAQSLAEQKAQAKKDSQEIRRYWAESLIGITEGTMSFKDIKRDLWRQIQKDTIYDIFGIENKKSIASKMLGKGKSALAAVPSNSSKSEEAQTKSSPNNPEPAIDKSKESGNTSVQEAQKKQAENESQKIKKYWADSLVGMTQGAISFKDFTRDIWSQIQKDAIYAIFGVENEASIASKTLGFGKAASAGVQSNGKLGIGKHAAGGVFTTPHIAAISENNDEEAVINISKNDDKQKGYLKYAANKMGVNLGNKTEYVPYFKNPELANNGTVNVQVQQQNENIKELQKANDLMRQQNQLILQMAGNGGNGNTTVVPIVTQVSSDQVFEALKQNPSVLYNILGRHQSSGWR